MKILLTGGGTAGHVVPHLALLNGIRKNYDKIISNIIYNINIVRTLLPYHHIIHQMFFISKKSRYTNLLLFILPPLQGHSYTTILIISSNNR